MAAAKKPTLQDMIRRRQLSEFVGRDEPSAQFQANLRYPPDDIRRHYIVHISGPGGVGKTWLLRHFRKLAEDVACLTAYVDETQTDVPEVMAHMAAQLESEGHSLKKFCERYKVYRQKRQEIEMDPEAPQGFPGIVGRSLAKGSFRIANEKVGGVLADFVDEDAFVAHIGDFTEYVVKKFKDKDDVELITKPLDVLTPLFLEGLMEIAEYHPPVLCFDTYEHTQTVLDTWLRALLDSQYGDVPVEIVVVIAGREPLDPNLWALYNSLILHFPLEVFTEAEARAYLQRKGITDAEIIDVILQLSGRLPLLLAMLAAQSPTDAVQVGDPSGDAVERFLKWVEDPRKREVVLNAALPRKFNRDIVHVLVEGDDTTDLFAWLKSMPHVQSRGEGWVYHEIVRMQMLRYRQRETAQSCTALHNKLAIHYETSRDNLGLRAEVINKGSFQDYFPFSSRKPASARHTPELAGFSDPQWQAYTLEALYHRLCQKGQQYLPYALNGFLKAFEAQQAFASRWAATIAQAGRDIASTEVQRYGDVLVQGVQEYEGHRYENAAAMFTTLLGYTDLEPEWRAIAHNWRGLTYSRAGLHKEGMEDLNTALKLRPNLVGALARRGVLYWLMGDYQRSLADLNSALEIAPDSAVILADRAITRRDLGHYEEAMRDFNRALELDPDLLWALGGRGKTYRKMHRYAEALQDYDRVAAAEDNQWNIAHRGMIHLLLGNYQAALADLDRAILIGGGYSWNVARRRYERALIYLALQKPEQALSDLEQSIRILRELCQENPQEWRRVFNLALSLLAAGQTDEAERLYGVALAGDVKSYQIHTAIVNLKEFLEIFPEHPLARKMCTRLQCHQERLTTPTSEAHA